ncbi:MAG: histidine--tRNA ligase [Acidobacteria bacterium]|nr:MAG: histidine--tRNA ligase [Acidobacteriota bacterium]REK04166.1 MAG: histidine--tRNA ligase [Acidobacteriota bacterium]REK15328.1 MAG: histidine--tRNA ligase [Acidobacteriota bacterium]REK46418.1 MAG: histidine--tRNA ligase [Acidobacteriota bacterium]
MTNTNPARGMRDFLPTDVRRRDYVIGVIKEVYEKYGYEPLETPSIENLATLTNKYGDEGNQLMYKILKRGEKLLQELAEGTVKDEDHLSDLALRYDLTVPLARVVANYRNDLPRFFKRYQIQPVWRADRPAKGRYREFYQCDVDAIGSNSLTYEAEQLAAGSEILKRLGFDDFRICINHRKVLSGVLEVSGVDNADHSSALVAIDKLDKIGIEGVIEELENRDIPVGKIKSLLEFAGKDLSAEETIKKLEGMLAVSEVGGNGIEDLCEILRLSTANGVELKIDPTLARGLSYYTGAIFEVRVPDLAGSLAGGGRYDDLIGMFGKEDIPACGFSIGLERILVVMEERGMFPEDIPTSPADVMVTVWDAETLDESLILASEMRKAGLKVVLYPQADKLGKQFKYADQIGVAKVCILGESELAEGTVSVKDMVSGEQKTVDRGEVASQLRIDG